jgi:hypothetical protein
MLGSGVDRSGCDHEIGGRGLDGGRSGDGDLTGFCPGKSGDDIMRAARSVPSRRWRVSEFSVGWPTSLFRSPAFSARCGFWSDASSRGRAPVAYGGAASCRADVRLACDAERRECAVEVADAILFMSLLDLAQVPLISPTEP